MVQRACIECLAVTVRIAVLSGHITNIQGAHSSSQQLIVEIDTSSSADYAIANDCQQPCDDRIDNNQGTLKLSAVVDLVADVGMRSAPIPTWCLVHEDRKAPTVTMQMRVSLVNVFISAAAQLPKGESEHHHCTALF